MWEAEDEEDPYEVTFHAADSVSVCLPNTMLCALYNLLGLGPVVTFKGDSTEDSRFAPYAAMSADDIRAAIRAEIEKRKGA